MTIAVVGCGLLGSDLSNTSTSNDLLFLEWGSTPPPLELFRHPREEQSHWDQRGGLALGVGGRSRHWGGVLLPSPKWVFESMIGLDPTTAAAAHLAQDTLIRELGGTQSPDPPAWIPNGLSVLSGHRIPADRRTILPPAGDHRILENHRVLRIQRTQNGLQLCGANFKIRADRLILSCGPLEAARLIGTLALADSCSNEVFIGGLGDHEAVGHALWLDTPYPYDDKLKYIALNSEGEPLCFVDCYAWGSGTMYDVWGFVTVGGAPGQGVVVRRPAATAVAVRYHEQASDLDRVRRYLTELSSVVEALNERLGARIHLADSVDTIPHFSEFTVPYTPAWRSYRCRAGSVQHEYMGGGIGKLLTELGLDGKIQPLGGASATSLAFANPTLAYISASRAALLSQI